MTKTYLGYGYTNNRGVAKLEYTPNNEKLTTTGYKNTHTNNTNITAQITHKNKTYNSNTKHYYGITAPTILYYNDGTKTDLQLPDGGSCTTNGEYLTFSNCYQKQIKFPVILEGDWEFSFEAKSQILFGYVVGGLEWSDNLRNNGTSIKIVCEQGILKQYADDVLVLSQTISSSNYSIAIKSKIISFSLDNIQIKRLGG